MPKIATYEAPQGLGLKPSETGIESTAAAARRLQGDYSEAATAQEATGRRLASAVEQAGDMAVKFIDHQQISHGAVALAGLIQQKTKEWDDASKASDPNDPTTAQRFLDQNLEPALQQFKSGFLTERGQQWAEQHIESFRSHMYNKTSADMATNAGIAAVNNHRQTVNGLAAAVYNDPSSLDFSLRTLEGSVGASVDSSPTLKGTAAARIKTELLQKGKEEIIKSAVTGMIARDPNVDLSEIEKKYPGYISGPEMRQFQKQAQAQAKQNEIRDRQIAQFQRQQTVEAAKAGLSKAWIDNIAHDENGRAIVDSNGRFIINPNAVADVAGIEKKNPGPDTAQSKAMIGFIQSQIRERKETLVTDKAVYNDLITRMADPNNTTTRAEILSAAAQHKLDAHDTSAALALLHELRQGPITD